MTNSTIRLACLALVAACGGDESDYPTETNPQYAALAVSQMAGIGAGTDAANPDGAAGATLQLSSQAPNIIYPVVDEGDNALVRQLAVAPLVGDCTCTSSGCEFDGCSDEAGTFTIDGSISVSGDTYSFDVSIDQMSGSDDFETENSIETSGELTITETGIEGSASGSTDSRVVITDPDGSQTIEAFYDWSIDVLDVDLDVSRCAVGGALEASVSAEAYANGRNVDYSGSGTVNFGPTCGEATVAE